MISKFESENVRSIYNTDLSELQKKFLNSEVHDSFHYIYTGKVLSNSDPLKQGRLKIQVINLFDNLNADDIPWAYPVQSFIDGSFSIPNVGDYLEVYFDHGDTYNPKYLGKALNLNQIPSHASDSYPNTIVLYQTKTGNYCTLNKLTGEFKIISQVGSKITMSPTGEVSVEALVVSIPHKALGFVPQDPTGGPFCSIPICPLTGIPHQGSKVINT